MLHHFAAKLLSDSCLTYQSPWFAIDAALCSRNWLSAMTLSCIQCRKLGLKICVLPMYYRYAAKFSTKCSLCMSSRGGHSWDFSDCWFSASAPRWTARHSKLRNLVAATLATRKRADFLAKLVFLAVECCRWLRACLVEALATRCPLVLGQDGPK